MAKTDTKSSIERRMKRVYTRACTRSDAVFWRHLKVAEAEIAALLAARTEMLRLRSLQRPRKRHVDATSLAAAKIRANKVWADLPEAE